MPGKFSTRAQAVRRERGEKVACLRTKLGSRIAGTGRQQHVAPGLQLGKIFDALADASLKCFLQRKPDAGNTDQRTACMQGVRNCRIEFGSKGDQAGSVGCS